tara:strand:- start:20 stop:388 length:369 start_codon:yes stop_codon:yes gene_type:complete
VTDKRDHYKHDTIYFYKLQHEENTMIAKNDNVLRAWRDGLKARNNKHTLRTDGKHLWSYRLLIGIRKGGVCFLKDATAPCGEFHSVTTSCHVGKARKYADIVFHPKVWAVTPEIGYIPNIPF